VKERERLREREREREKGKIVCECVLDSLSECEREKIGAFWKFSVTETA